MTERTKEKGNGTEDSKEIPWQGPICLGHIIKSPKSLDQVKNRSGLKPYPASMPVYRTQAWGLTTEIDTGRHLEPSVKEKGPVGATPVELSFDIATFFKKTVQNHSQFERLDTMTIYPTEAYQKESIKDADVQKFIGRVTKKHLGLNFWTLYMITGIAVAIGATGSWEEILEKGASGGGGADALGIAGGSARIGVGDNATTKMSFKKASDFVWAVRLLQISKSLFSSDITDKTLVGATYSKKEAEEIENIQTEEAFLKDKGLNPETSRMYCAKVKDAEIFLVVQSKTTKDESDSDEAE
jgi:hypothetical protein